MIRLALKVALEYARLRRDFPTMTKNLSREQVQMMARRNVRKKGNR